MTPTTRTPGPAVAASRLRSRLLRYRQKAQLTQLDVANALDWSESKLYRIENGPGRIQTSDLLAMLSLYGVDDDDERKAVVELGRASRQPGVSTRYGRHLDPKFVEFVDYEAFADRFYNYETKLIPGVIQNHGYADAVATGLRLEPDDDEAAVVVDARNERAQYLTGRHGPTARFIIDESALHRAVGGEGLNWDRKYDVMTRVFEHLKVLNTAAIGLSAAGGETDAADRNPDLAIQIVPFELGAYSALRGPFVLLEFDDPDDETLVYLENPDSQEILRDPDASQRYREMFLRLSQQVPGPEATSAILDHIADTFPSRLKQFPLRSAGENWQMPH
jgi:transcriptional regulator with XRE-family HTH domain